MQNLIDGSISEYRLSGYLSTDTKWKYAEVYSIGEGALNNLPVHFANDGTNPVICFGDVNKAWDRTKIQVTDVMLGHYDFGYAKWYKDWNIAVVADNSDLTVHSTVESPNQLTNALAGYVPLNGGGEVQKTSDIPFAVKNTTANSNTCLIAFTSGDGATLAMGLSGGKAVISGKGEIFHQGNSTGIKFTEDSTTAPTADMLWAHL